MNRASDTASTSPLTNPLLLVMVLAAFTSVLNNSMVNVAIPAVSAHLNVSASASGWIVTAYSIVFATGVALYGRVSDSYSLRATFLAALVIFGIGSLACALAPSCKASGFGIIADGKFYHFDDAGNKQALALLKATEKESALKVFVEGHFEEELIKVSAMKAVD